jgi:hypothetical protein
MIVKDILINLKQVRWVVKSHEFVYSGDYGNDSHSMPSIRICYGRDSTVKIDYASKSERDEDFYRLCDAIEAVESADVANVDEHIFSSNPSILRMMKRKLGISPKFDMKINDEDELYDPRLPF